MRVEHSYAVSPDRLFQVLTEEEYLAERGRRYGGAAPPVVERSSGRVVVTTVRQVSADKVPSQARRYLGDGRLVQVDTWTSPAQSATITVDAGTMPLVAGGTQEIRPTAEGCVHVVTINLKVKVPLVGRLIGRALDAQLQKLFSAEMTFAETWLSRTPG